MHSSRTANLIASGVDGKGEYLGKTTHLKIIGLLERGGTTYENDDKQNSCVCTRERGSDSDPADWPRPNGPTSHIEALSAYHLLRHR